jgi:hypothetical protein
MKIHWITHFDRDYLPLGCAMLESLNVASPGCRVSVLPLDYETRNVIGEQFPWVDIVDWDAFFADDERQLEAAKSKMSRKEFAWFLEVALCNYFMDRTDADWLAYTDADMLWFQDLAPVLAGVPREKCVCLTPHHFPAHQQHREESVGRYNFGVGAFKPTCPEARLLLQQWFDAAFKNCGENTAGHQPYLNQWIGLPQVHELPETVNIGPWSLPIIGTGDERRPVSYHFHEFRQQNGLSARQPRMIGGVPWNLTNYPIHPYTLESAYEPYVRSVESWIAKLKWSPS